MAVRFSVYAVRDVRGNARFKELVDAYLDHPDLEEFEVFMKREYPNDYVVVMAALRLKQ